MRKLLLGLSLCTSGVLVLLGATFAYAQTTTGKSQIAGFVQAALSDEQTEAEVEELTGFMPFNFEVGRISLADDTGVWLEAEGIEARLSPTDFLRGVPRLTRAGAERLAIHRLPERLVPEAEPAPAGPFALPDLPQLPDTLPVALVDHFEIARIELGEPLLGEAAVLNVVGSLAVEDEGRTARAELDLVRLDAETLAASLTARLGLEDETLMLALAAEETGGLVARLAGVPEAGDLRLSLAGDGPLADWRGTLEAELERMARLEGEIALALAEDLAALDLDARLVPGELMLTDEVAPLVGESVDLALALRQTPEELVLEDLRMLTAAAVLSGEGRIDAATEELAASLSLQIADLAPLDPVLPIGLAGSVRADVSASGTLAAPRLDLDLLARNLAAADIYVAELSSRLEVHVLDRYAGAQVEGTGRADGLEIIAGPPLPDDSLTWSLAALVPEDGPIRLDRLQLQGAQMALDASGTFDPQAGLGEGRLDLAIEELAVLTAALGPELTGGLELSGAAHLAADLALDEAAETVTGRLDASFERLAGLPPGAAELLGPAPRLGADLAFRPGDEARLVDLVLEGAGVRLAGDLATDLVTEAVAADLVLELPDLAVLETAVGQALGGALRVDAALTGTVREPELRLDLEGRDILVGEERFEQATGFVTASGALDDLEGALQLAVDHAGERLAVSSSYRLQNGVVAVPDLRVTGPGTEIHGDLVADLEGPLVDGQLSGRIDSLAALQPWHQLELAGSVDFDAVLAAVDGRQDARVSLAADHVAGDFGRVRLVRLDADVIDAMGALGVTANARIEDFVEGDLEVDRAAIEAAGALEAINLTAELEGRLGPDEFDLDARAFAQILTEVQLVRLDALDGRFGDDRLTLMAPATVELDGDTLRIDRLDLRLGAAELRTELDIGPGRIFARADLSSMPLAMLEPFGAPPAQGVMQASLRLEGTPAAPVGTLQILIDNLAADDPLLGNVPPATVRADARLENGRLSAGLVMEQLLARPIEASLTIPVTFGVAPFAFDVPPEGAVTASLDARASLEQLALLAGLDVQRIEGDAVAALAVEGTVQAPQVVGELTVENGVYEHGDTGTVLRNIFLRARGTEQALRIEQLRATDGAAGRMGGRGELRFDPEAAFPFEVELVLNRANLVRRADVDATMTGNIRFAGDMMESLIEGRLVVDEAEIAIPDPEDRPTIAVIPVTERRDSRIVAEPQPRIDEPMRIALDVEIDMPARVFVRGRGLDSEWRGQLNVTGAANQPRVVGNLNVQRGWFDFLDRRFELDEGLIDFDGGEIAAPFIRIEAGTATRELDRALVRIEGRPDDIQLSLDSVPSLPQDEVMAHILFDRDMRRITPVQGIWLAAAINQLRGGGGIDAVARLRRTVGLDVLDIGGEGLEDGTVRAGAYVRDDVFVEVERGLAEGTGRARVQVEVTRNFHLETEVQEAGGGGVGIQWRYDY